MVAQLVECLPSMHEALGLIPRQHKLGIVTRTCNPDPWEVRQEDQKFKAMPSNKEVVQGQFETGKILSQK